MDLIPLARDVFGETGIAPTRKGSTAKATRVEKYILTAKEEIKRNKQVKKKGGRILGRRRR
jgi:hypothetical protein